MQAAKSAGAALTLGAPVPYYSGGARFAVLSDGGPTIVRLTGTVAYEAAVRVPLDWIKGGVPACQEQLPCDMHIALDDAAAQSLLALQRDAADAMLQQFGQWPRLPIARASAPTQEGHAPVTRVTIWGWNGAIETVAVTYTNGGAPRATCKGATWVDVPYDAPMPPSADTAQRGDGGGITRFFIQDASGATSRVVEDDAAASPEEGGAPRSCGPQDVCHGDRVEVLARVWGHASAPRESAGMSVHSGGLALRADSVTRLFA